MYSKVYSLLDAELLVPTIAPYYVVLFAVGIVNKGGWSDGQLQSASYAGIPEEKFMDFDFVAVPPHGNVTEALEERRAAIPVPIVEGFDGVRVHSATKTIVLNFPNKGTSTIELKNLGDHWPWFLSK